ATRRLGDQFDDATEQGPQIDRVQIRRIDQLVQKAVAGGATCVTGGAPRRPFYEPTLLMGTTNDMSINQEDIFGPVATLSPFSDIDEAIALSNDRTYDLAAAIWTRNGQTAEIFARNVRAGTCWINCYEHFDPGAPWGRRKLSGVGRELGLEGIEPFLA